MSDTGWRKLPWSEDVEAWALQASKFADQALTDPALDYWYRCERTWFAGVDCLENDQKGVLPDGTLWPGSLSEHIPPLPLHNAQVSALFPGYPKAMETDSPGAARYRLMRDAAHVDGLLPTGPERRRKLKEPHAYILGIPLTDTPSDASPLVVWEGSHHIMAKAFGDALRPHDPKDWDAVDLTDTYQAARRECFDSCPRREVSARPGEAILLHRHLLHGMAPWRAPEGPPRIVAYFRPQGAIANWLD